MYMNVEMTSLVTEIAYVSEPLFMLCQQVQTQITGWGWREIMVKITTLILKKLKWDTMICLTYI